MDLPALRASKQIPLTLYDAFSIPETTGRLTHLRLESFSPILILFVVSTLTSLVRLEIERERAFPGMEWRVPD
jgi:hypothetical protein